mgnify:CR=1 FL=1
MEKKRLVEKSPATRKDDLIVINLSGRGDKDVMQVAGMVGLAMPK